jgi:outer membrane protein
MFGFFNPMLPVLADQKLPVWEFGLGPSVFSFPDYPGSKEQNTLLLSFPHIVYRGDSFQVNKRELIKPLFEQSNLEVSLSLSGSIPVSSKDNKMREGMDNLDGTVGIGPVIKYQIFKQGLSNVQFELPLRAIIASDFTYLSQEGWAANPMMSYFFRKDMGKHQRLKLSMGVGARFATEKNHNYFYGVPLEDERAGRSAYQASSGFSGVNYRLGFDVHFKRFWLGGFWRGQDMSKAVFKDSPLVETNFSHTFGVTLTWNFFQSKKTVLGLEQ